MTELPTPETAISRPRTSLVVLAVLWSIGFLSSIGAVRDWTDVKIAAALAAVLCIRSSRQRLFAIVGGAFVGHLVLGATIGVGDWPLWAWFAVAMMSAIASVVLLGLLRVMTSDSTSSLPSKRIAVFLVGAAVISVVAGSTESLLLGAADASSAAATVDIVFGFAIAACLAAIAVTRRGAEWFSSERHPGAELLGPLLVVLVTLVAVQVTRQVSARRDDDRFDVVAGSIGATLSAQWKQEERILAIEAKSMAPSVAFDEQAFADLATAYLSDSETAVAAALAEESESGEELRVIDWVADGTLAKADEFSGDFWETHREGSVVAVDDGSTPVVVRRVELVPLPQGGALTLSVAYSLSESITRTIEDAFGRFDGIAFAIDVRQDSATSRVWFENRFDLDELATAAATLDMGGSEVDVVVQPTSTFGSATATVVSVLGIEVAVGSLLMLVLVLGANAQFTMTQERRRRENLLEAALDATPGISVVFGSDFRVLAANRPVREQFAGRIPGLEVWEIFGLEGSSGRRRMIEDVLEAALEGRQAQTELAQDAVEGSDSSATNQMRIIELSAYPVTSPGGEPVGFLHSVDATERRSLAMRSAQSERMESLGALAGGLAHDFNNLLFVTLGNLQLMAMNETVTRDEKLSKFLSRSMSAVERGAEITRSLLAVARSQPLEESAVSLADLVKGILPLVRQALGAGRRVEVDLPDPSLLLMVDSGRLSSCILNLAFNARDAMGPNGTLRIASRLDESTDMIELSVADDGSGMPADVVARAFEPFFTTKSAGSGTGLGLATVYAFAKQSGGTAYLESRIGAGTTVTLVLPRFTGRAPSHEVTAARRSGRRVVVADDEQSLAEMVAAWLIDMGIDARFATSPKSALELIETFEPDVLVSDANFGEELDGIELARLGTAIVPDMAVVFMTGYSTSMRELQELGERTLAKPFSREDPYAALSPLIAEEESSAQPRATTSVASRKKSRPS